MPEDVAASELAAAPGGHPGDEPTGIRA
jgi:hypothetical protein